MRVQHTWGVHSDSVTVNTKLLNLISLTRNNDIMSTHPCWCAGGVDDGRVSNVLPPHGYQLPVAGFYLKSNKKVYPLQKIEGSSHLRGYIDNECKNTLSDITNKKRYNVDTPLLAWWSGWRRESIPCVTTPQPPAANDGFGKGFHWQFFFSQRWTLRVPTAWKWKIKVCPVNEVTRH